MAYSTKGLKRICWKVKMILSAFMILFLTACGKEEYPDTQMGIDGYVYASKIIQQSASALANEGNYILGSNASAYNRFVAAGDYLYYCRESYPNSDMRRLLLTGDDAELKLEKGKLLFKISHRDLYEPEAVNVDGERDADLYDLLQAAESYSLYMENYAVDADLNIYCCEKLYTGTSEEMEGNGCIVSRRGEDGDIVWQKFLPSASGEIAVDREGKLFVLTGNRIVVLDGEGRQTSVIELNEFWNDEMSTAFFGAGSAAFIGADGYVYVDIEQNSLSLYEKNIYEVRQDGSFQKIEAVSGNTYDSVFGTREGNLLLVHRYDGCVYEYDRESGQVGILLRWEDSGLIKDKVVELLGLKDGEMLANHSGTIYLLEKTPIEELPERELVVLASLDPEDDLRKAVIEFNMRNSQYHVMIEEYGAGGDYEAARVRLDGKLVSSNPPDLLDMAGLDIYKYARQGVLEDINGILEKSSVLNREDFLENVLEGYTIEGKLVCIPRRYAGGHIAGRASQLKKIDGWTMEDVYELTEQYPEYELLLNRDREYLLEYFCSAYYLEEFVNWEAGDCSFDSEKFIALLEWIGRFDKRETEMNSSVPEDVLLDEGGLGFEEGLHSELKFGEEVCLMGFPGNGGACFLHALDEVGIVEKALHKEGAIAFLEYYLSRPWDRWVGNNTTRRDFLLKLAEEAARPIQFASMGFIIDGEYIPYDQTPQRLIDQMLALIENTDFTPRSQTEKDIIQIVVEEASFC